MKKSITKLLALALLISLSISMVPAFTLQTRAAYKTDSVTLLVGEALVSTLSENVKSVSTSLDGTNIAIKCKNKYSGRVSGEIYVKVFDGEDLIAMKNLSIYLNGSQTKTDTIPISSIMSTHPNLTIQLESASFFSKIY